MLRRPFASFLVLWLGAGAALLVSEVPAGAVATHTWVGADLDNPHDWARAQNWDDQSVPEDGDIIVIEADRITNVPSDKVFTEVTLKNGAYLDSGGPLVTEKLTAACVFSDVDIDVRGTIWGDSEVYGLDMNAGTTFTNQGAVEVTMPPFGDWCTLDTAGHVGELRLFPGAVFDNWATLKGSGTVRGWSAAAARRW